jgi:hypothetical protein
MEITVSNERILKGCRFLSLPNRELWVSPDLREAFSYEMIDGHDTQWLNQHLAGPTAEEGVLVLFNDAPENTDDVCREILAEIGLPGLSRRFA